MNAQLLLPTCWSLQVPGHCHLQPEESAKNGIEEKQQVLDNEWRGDRGFVCVPSSSQRTQHMAYVCVHASSDRGVPMCVRILGEKRDDYGKEKLEWKPVRFQGRESE